MPWATYLTPHRQMRHLEPRKQKFSQVTPSQDGNPGVLTPGPPLILLDHPRRPFRNPGRGPVQGVWSRLPTFSQGLQSSVLQTVRRHPVPSLGGSWPDGRGSFHCLGTPQSNDGDSALPPGSSQLMGTQAKQIVKPTSKSFRQELCMTRKNGLVLASPRKASWRRLRRKEKKLVLTQLRQRI